MVALLALLGGPKSVTVDWSPEWPFIGPHEKAAVADLLERRVLSIYDRSGIVADFEDAFAEYHATQGQRFYAIAHNSGTSALHAAYFGIGLGPGDEVIVPTYTFLATVTPLLQCGATPIFADMDPYSLTIDPDSVAERISSRTRAIVATHMWGHPADMSRLLAIADRFSLPLVEDCSHAHGAVLAGQKVGTFGIAAAFSLEGHKAMTAGEGGVLLTSSRQVYERALMLGHFGRRIKDEVARDELRPFVETGFGHKYRIHPLGAAIALEQLGQLDGRNAQRKANLDLLAQLLIAAPGIEPPITRSGASRGAWYGFKAHYVGRELGYLPIARYCDALRAEGVLVKKPGSAPLHSQPIFRLSRAEGRALRLPWSETLPEQQRTPDKCPVADAIYPVLLSLPTFSGECEAVIRQYGKAFKKVGENCAALLDENNPSSETLSLGG